MHTQQYEALRSALETYMDGVLPLPDTLWPEGNMPRTLVKPCATACWPAANGCARCLLAAYGLYHSIWHRRCPLQRRWSDPHIFADP